MKGRVLIAAGSDSGGGAGIQADIKAVTALNGFAMTAITALTAQNTLGVEGIHEIPAAFVRRQIEVVAADLGADAAKTGMLATAEVIETVAESFARFLPGVPVVVDPVMVAKGGAHLLEDSAAETLRRVLVPMAFVLTPNLFEAEVLTGRTIEGEADMLAAARDLLAMGAKAVLLKGGHLPGDALTDLLLTPEGPIRFTNARIPTPHTHGTGCTTASAIACGLAQGMGLKDAVARALAYVHRAIATAPGFGHGHGPLNHAHTVREGV